MLNEDQLAGIITPKDIMVRVVAKELDPDTTPVSAVMTPNPDTVTQDMTVVEALREASAAKDSPGFVDVARCRSGDGNWPQKTIAQYRSQPTPLELSCIFP